MDLPSKNEWSEIIVVAVVAGGLSGGIAMLQHLGFDENATLAFVGAVVGAAAAVLLSRGEQERQRRSAARREREQITVYFESAGLQIDGFVGSPFNVDDEGRLSVSGCEMASYTVENLRNYAVQAVRHATHIDFLARAQLEAVVEQCARTLAALRQIVAASDEFDGRSDFEAGKRAIVNLHNTMTLFLNL